MLLGVMPRSGTNFFVNQLRLHPSCKTPGPVWEDFLISKSGLLNRYIKEVAKSWDSYWFRHSDEDYSKKLKKAIGSGLEQFLLEQLSKEGASENDVLISKTPTVKGLNNFAQYFEGVKVILVVRNGASVVESGKKSFDWNFEKAAYDWRNNIRLINNFTQFNPGLGLVVKYEDLCTNVESTVADILNYLELSLDEFPFEEAKNLPVSGSSELKKNTGEIHWTPLEKSENFKPLERHLHWSSWKKSVFDFIAGEEMALLGYAEKPKQSGLLKLLIRAYLITWPLRAFFPTCYYIFKDRKFILKTN